MTDQELIAIVTSFNDAWNGHDLEKIVSFFADNGTFTITPTPPHVEMSTWTGKDQLMGVIQAQLPGFTIEASAYTVTSNKVTWNFKVSSDTFRQLGIEHSEGTSEAVIVDGKLQSFSLNFNPETLQSFAKNMPKTP